MLILREMSERLKFLMLFFQVKLCLKLKSLKNTIKIKKMKRTEVKQERLIDFLGLKH